MMGVIFIGLNVLDAYLTKTALTLEATELTPLAEFFGSNMLWKGLIAGGIVGLLYLFHKERLLKYLNIGMALICLWNFSQIVLK